MKNAPTVGFIGFGELAASWAAELGRAGVQVSAYLPRDARSRRSGLKELRQGQAGIAPTDDLGGVVAGATLLIAAVPAATALQVACDCAPHITPGLLYADPSTASPAQKEQAADVVHHAGGLYVDVAVLGTVTLSGLAVPLLASGPGASQFCSVGESLRMRIVDAGPTTGDAARVKLIRSVYMKGRDALLVEMLAAARMCGLENEVVDSISAAPGEQVSFRQLVDRVLPALVHHAGRRSEELAAAAGEVGGLGLSPIMSEAGARRLRWMAALESVRDLRSEAGEPLRDDVVAALAEGVPVRDA